MPERFLTAAATHAAARAKERYRVRLDADSYALLCDKIDAGHEAKFVCSLSEEFAPDRQAWLVLHESTGWMLAVYNTRTRLILSFLPLSTQFTARGVPYWDKERWPRGIILEEIDDGR